jgi:hypothetical protein
LFAWRFYLWSWTNNAFVCKAFVRGVGQTTPLFARLLFVELDKQRLCLEGFRSRSSTNNAFVCIAFVCGVGQTTPLFASPLFDLGVYSLAL